MFIKSLKEICFMVIIIALFSGVSFGAEILLDWNESGNSGETWSGWTWYPDSADDYNHPGWRKNDGKWMSGNTNWMPRIHEKSDYGNDNLAIIDTSVIAPSTNAGASLKVYDTGNKSIYQSCYWFLYDDNFGAKGLADATTNRFGFYFKPTGMNASDMTQDIGNANVHIGTYLCWDGGGSGGESCPKEANGQHYYHYLTVHDGTWLHVVLDRHPTHRRGASGSGLPDDNPAAPKNYYEYMNALYVELRYPHSAPTAYWIDEMMFYTTSQPENDISIASVWVGYWPDTDKWEIGFNDNSFNSVGYNGSSQSTFEVRYSTSPITNANYAQATVAEPEYWERGTSNTFRRPNSWKKPAWIRFQIPDDLEESSKKIYFAIKDVSSTANGDGHDSQSALIHTIDYALDAVASDPSDPPVTSPLSIPTDALSDGETDAEYEAAVSAHGGVPPYTWSLSSGSLPFDLSLSSSGVISGIPLVEGTEVFSIKVSDSDLPNSTITKTFRITVNEASPSAILIDTAELPAASLNQNYNASLVVTGGISPYTWSLAGGTLPDGVTLSASGVVSGIPITEGLTSFDVEVIDGAASIATKHLTLSVIGASSDILAYWALDEGGGMEASDSASGMNKLTLHGAEWTKGNMGFALSFDGTSHYAHRADSDLIGAFPGKSSGATDDFTLSAWIFLNKLNIRHPIISKQGNGNRGFLFLVEDSNRLSIQLFNKTGIRTEVFSSDTLEAGQWYHVAAIYDYDGDGKSSINLYINGVNTGATGSAVGPVKGNSEALELGRYYWSGSYSRYMNGVIDDVQIYDRALSATEISAVASGDGETPSSDQVPGAPTNLEVIMD